MMSVRQQREYASKSQIDNAYLLAEELLDLVDSLQAYCDESAFDYGRLSELVHDCLESGERLVRLWPMIEVAFDVIDRNRRYAYSQLRSQDKGTLSSLPRELFKVYERARIWHCIFAYCIAHLREEVDEDAMYHVIDDLPKTSVGVEFVGHPREHPETWPEGYFDDCMICSDEPEPVWDDVFGYLRCDLEEATFDKTVAELRERCILEHSQLLRDLPHLPCDSQESNEGGQGFLHVTSNVYSILEQQKRWHGKIFQLDLAVRQNDIESVENWPKLKALLINDPLNDDVSDRLALARLYLWLQKTRDIDYQAAINLQIREVIEWLAEEANARNAISNALERSASESPTVSAVQQLLKQLVTIPEVPSVGITAARAQELSILATAQKLVENNPLSPEQSAALRDLINVPHLRQSVSEDVERMAADLVQHGFRDPRENRDNWRIIALQVGVDPDATMEDIYESAIGYRLRNPIPPSLGPSIAEEPISTTGDSESLAPKRTRQSAGNDVYEQLTGQSAKLFRFLLQKSNFVDFETLRQTAMASNNRERIFRKKHIEDESIRKAIKRLNDDLLEHPFTCEMNVDRVKLVLLQ